MNDLIRRGDVLKLFPINDCSDKMVGLYERVLDIPTAYDVDKVVAEIQKKYCQRCRNILSVPGAEEYCKRQKCRIYEICDMVKRGGIND